MKIFTAEQVRAWDEATIQKEGITPADLMERAAEACAKWLLAQFSDDLPYMIFCGHGANGGDGLAIARRLHIAGRQVRVFAAAHEGAPSPLYASNLQALKSLPVAVHQIEDEQSFPVIHDRDIVVDSIFGTGLNRPPGGSILKVIRYINQSDATVVSIDLPSGLFADAPSDQYTVIRADYTLTFQSYKLAFLLSDHAELFGKVTVLDIGLDAGFAATMPAPLLVDLDHCRKLYRPRKTFAHKGSFGHALLFCGSYGKMGAGILAAKAAARSGCGLLTCYLPAEGLPLLQATLPEAMVMTGAGLHFLEGIPPLTDAYNAIGIGPGIGTKKETASFLRDLLRKIDKPIVIDADGLNIIARHNELFSWVPAGSILTPHPKEFDRLFGACSSHFERVTTARKMADEKGWIIILKGHHTYIAVPGSFGYFNSSGNAGMAKGGSGDVLTGILTSLLAQGYGPVDAAVFGVFLHGLAGDIASASWAQESMLPSDLVLSLSDAFRCLAGEM